MRKILLLIFLFMPKLALALDMDFYTYGGFNETLTAFQRIALIFNDGQYIVLFFIACLFGIIFGGIISFVKGVMGQEGGGSANTFSFMIYVLVGVALFKAMIIPQGNVNVFDPVLHRFQVVGGVPDIIVAFAGFTNKLERAVTESVDGAAAHPRELQGGGKGLEMFINSFYGDPLNSRAYLAKSVSQYIQDCLPPAETVAGYAFDLQAIKSGTLNLRNELSKLKSPSVFTTHYTAANKSGVSMSCDDAWDTQLAIELTAGGLYDSYIADICSQSGFDVGDPAVSAAQTARCSAIIEDTGDMLFDPAAFTNTTKMMEDIMITRQIILSLSSTPASALSKLANRDITQTGLASQMVTENWLPTIRSVVFALVLGIMPVIMLFLVTPMVFKALHLGVGLFLFICIWGVTDAVVHGVATDQIVTMMQGLKTGTMGLNEIMMMPDQAMKGLAIIGKSQSMGIVLASLITTFFFKVSSYAFNQMSEKYQQDIDRFGDDAANKTLTPEGRLHATDTHAQVEAMGSISEKHGLDGYIGAQSMPSVQNLSSSIAHSNALGSGPSIGGRMSTAERTGELAGSEVAGSTLGTEGYANLSGIDPNTLSRDAGIKSSVTKGADTLAAKEVAANRDSGFIDTVGNSSFVEGANHLNQNIERGRAAQEASPNSTLVDAIQANRAQSATDEVGQVVANDKSNKYVADQNGVSSVAGSAIRHENTNAPGVGKAVEFGNNVKESYENEQFQAAVERANTDNLEQRIAPERLGKGEAISRSTSADAKVQVENSQGYGGIVAGERLSQEREVSQAAAATKLQEQSGINQDQYLDKIAIQQQADQLADAETFQKQKGLLDVNDAEIAAKRSGATNNNLALDSDDVEKLYEQGVISDDNYIAAQTGGHANITLGSDGTPLRTSIENGSSAKTDNDTEISRETSLRSGLNTDGKTVAQDLRDPVIGGLLIDKALQSEVNRGELTSDIADYLGQYTDSSVTASDQTFFRNNAYANADASLTVGTPGLLDAVSPVKAEATASAGIHNEVGTQGDTIDSERVDGHKATAEQWFDDAQNYAMSTISDYRESGLTLDGAAAKEIESVLVQSYLADRLDAVATTERNRMSEIAKGENALFAPGSDSLERNTEKQ